MEKKKDENNFSKKQSSILIAVIVLFAFLITTGIFLSNNVKDTYSVDTGGSVQLSGRKVQFMGDSGYNLSSNATYGSIAPQDGICNIDVNGFIDAECGKKIAKVCCAWSKGKSGSYPTGCSGSECTCNDAAGVHCQSKDLETTNLFKTVFDSSKFTFDSNNVTKLYCYYGSSNVSNCSVDTSNKCFECKTSSGTEYVTDIECDRAAVRTGGQCHEVADSKCTTPTSKCYVCKTDSNVFKWGTNGNSDGACSAGYNETNKTKAQCVSQNKCYACKTDETIVKWSTNGNKDDKCSAGYNETNKTQTQCVSSSCYVCRSDSSIMKWGNNGNKDDKCPEGYNVTTTPKTSCVTGKSCYQCKTDESIMKWSDNGNKDSNCPSGYNKTNKTASECPPQIHENPKTGTVAIIFAWVIGVIALLYSCFYVIKLNKIK